MLRYAVLHHTGGAEVDHFDFLFESAPGSQLVTFRLPEWPPNTGTRVRKLKDHRRLYLDYEGDVPGNRGRVDRVAEGQLTVTCDGDAWLLSRPDGRPFLLFEPRFGTGDEDWHVTPLPP